MAVSSILETIHSKGTSRFDFGKFKISDVFWSDFIDRAMDQLVVPALAYQIEKSQLSGVVPSLVERYCNSLLRINRSRNEQIAQEIILVAEALNNIGVVPLFLKGASGQLVNLYEDPGIRIMSDIDMLVQPKCIAQSIEQLKAIGYRSSSNLQHPYLQSVQTFIKNGAVAPVDLHHSILMRQHSKLIQAEEVFADAVVAKVGNVRFAVPNPTHQALINIAHAELHDRAYWYGDLPLRSLLDLCAIQNKYGDLVDWDSLETQFTKSGYATAFNYHCLAANRFLGASIPRVGKNFVWAELLVRRAIFFLSRPRIKSIDSRIARVLMLLRQELSDSVLRKRLLKNMMTVIWWKRHLLKLLTASR